MTTKIAIFGSVERSGVDGPGWRVVVHFAGCSVRCPGCFNRELWNRDGANVRWLTPSELVAEIVEFGGDWYRGVTISGGEPTDQMIGLYEFLFALHRENVSTVLYTGRTMEWLNEGSAQNPRVDLWWDIMAYHLVDVVIDGAFERENMETEEVMRGSKNQRVNLVSSFHRASDFATRDVEVKVSDGRIVILGFPDEELIALLGMGG